MEFDVTARVHAQLARSRPVGGIRIRDVKGEMESTVCLLRVNHVITLRYLMIARAGGTAFRMYSFDRQSGIQIDPLLDA